jgi:hypothetical protein
MTKHDNCPASETQVVLQGASRIINPCSTNSVSGNKRTEEQRFLQFYRSLQCLVNLARTCRFTVLTFDSYKTGKVQTHANMFFAMFI